MDADQSAALREQLLADIAQLQSADEAADWVHKNLPTKNTLVAADAHLVEASFSDRLATIELLVTETPSAERGHRPEATAANTELGCRRNAILHFDGQFHRSADRSGSIACSSPSRRRQDHPPARQGALRVCRDPAVRRLWPHAG